MKRLGHFMLIICTLLAGCERDADLTPAVESPGAPRGEVSGNTRRSAGESTTRDGSTVRIVFLGDSLTAGYGLDADKAFPALLEEELERERVPVQIVNAGLSGDTTAGGLRRIDWLMGQSPDIVVVGLGGNDGLRGTKLDTSEQNLRTIVRKAREGRADVLLLGMLMPPNYGPEYTTEFRELYRRIATDMEVPLVPFVLEGVGGDPRLNLPDGIHPTAEGHRIIARNILPYLKPLVERRLN